MLSYRFETFEMLYWKAAAAKDSLKKRFMKYGHNHMTDDCCYDTEY